MLGFEIWRLDTDARFWSGTNFTRSTRWRAPSPSHIHIPGRCFYDQLKKEKVPALIPRNAAWKILYVCLRWLFLFLECFFQTLDSILGIKSEFKVVAQKLHLHPLFNITATWQRVSFVRESNFLCTAEAQWTRVGLALTSAGTAQWESNCKIHHLTTTTTKTTQNF